MTAWNALVAADYSAAIANAEKCIQDFKDTAKGLQADMEKAGKQLPSGSVTGEARIAILANGPLNDVATCYFTACPRLGTDRDGAGRVSEVE